MGLDRRTFLKSVAAATIGSALGCERAAEPPAPRNVVLILTDDLNAGVLGYAGGQAQTPHVDALASRGMIFDAAYTAAIPCVPSRGCIMTGRYIGGWKQMPPTQTDDGGVVPGGALVSGQWTWARALRDAGCRTALIGKMHFNPMRADQGFVNAEYCEQGLFRYTSPNERHEDDYERWLQEHGVRDWQNTPRGVPPGKTALLAESRRYHSAQLWPYADELHPISWVRDRAIAFLGRAHREPFSLVVSFRYPHAPLNPARRFADLYPPDRLVMPTDHWDDTTDMPPAFRALGDQGGLLRDALDASVARRILAYYLALVSQVDDAIGSIAKHVDWSSTLVLFTSDHGDYVGHRDRFQKFPFVGLEPIGRVPLVACGPGVPEGTRASGPTVLVDLAPTLLEAAGVEAPDGLDGQPLQRYFEDASHGRERLIHCWSPMGIPMVRRGTVKYLRDCASGEELLFDLATDPEERTNLAGHPDWQETRRELAAEIDASDCAVDFV